MYLIGCLPKKDDFQHSFIWDYNSAYPIAEIANALSSDVAYTSFEADGKGNWTIPSYTPNSIEARTGKLSYSLSSGAISKAGLVLNRKYVISFWAKTGATVSLNGSSVIPTLDPAINSWEYYETSLTGSPTVTSATISGTGTIDELRLFPEGAQMTTYTFSPSIGMTSATDANNVKTYFEYDVLGRLATVKDDQGKILKTYKYNYKQ